jgi:hypothetical protein
MGGVVNSVLGMVLGIPFGLLAIYFGLVMAAYPFKMYAPIVNKLKPLPAEQAQGLTGLQMITGKPTNIQYLTAPVTGEKCVYYEQGFYRKVTERDGDTRLEKDKSESAWAVFKISNISFQAKNARPYIVRNTKEFNRGKNKNGEQITERIETINFDDNITVVGYLEDNMIKDGEITMISNDPPDVFKKNVRTGEMIISYALKFVCLILTMTGIRLIFLPIEQITGWIPVLGFATRGTIIAVSVFGGVILVFLASIFPGALWLTCLLVAGLGILAFVSTRKAQGTAQQPGNYY